MLRKFGKMFPTNATARIVLAYLRYQGLPLTEETDEEKQKAKEEHKALDPARAAVPLEDPLDTILASYPLPQSNLETMLRLRL